MRLLVVIGGEFNGKGLILWYQQVRRIIQVANERQWNNS